MIDLFLKFLFFFLFQLLLYLYIVGKGIDKIPIFSKREITYQDNSIKRLYFNFNIHDTIIRDYYSFLLVTSRWADNFPSPIIFRNIIHFPVQYLNWSKINIIQTSLNTPDNYRCLVHHWFYLPFYIHTHTYTETDRHTYIYMQIMFRNLHRILPFVNRVIEKSFDFTIDVIHHLDYEESFSSFSRYNKGISLSWKRLVVRPMRFIGHEVVNEIVGRYN